MRQKTGFVRGLGRWDIAFITINSTIGAGILGLPGKVYALLGPYSVFTCLAGGILMSLIAACYAECGSRFQGTGGSYLYAQAAFGPRTAFFTGWLAIASRLLAYASIINLLVNYADGLLPGIASPAGRVLVITAVSLALGTIIFVGIKLSAQANAAFTVLKLALLGGFVLGGIFFLAPFHLPPAPPIPPIHNWAPALVLMLFGLIGMDSAVVNGQEMRQPRTNIPFGLSIGMLAVVILYAGILLVCAGVVPNLAHSSRPLFDGAIAMAGPAAGALVVCGAVISMAGTLFTILLVGPRLVFALAEGGQLPGLFARLHPRFGTPAAAVLLHTAIAWGIAIASGFLGALTASTLTRLMLYALTAASLVVLRHRRLSEQARPLLLPGGAAIALAAIALAATALCLWLMFQADRPAWLAALACLALATLTLIVGRKSAATSATTPPGIERKAP